MARPSWLYDEDTLKDVLPVGVLVLLLGLRVLGLCCCASTSSRARARRRVHLVIVSLVLGLGCAAAALLLAALIGLCLSLQPALADTPRRVVRQFSFTPRGVQSPRAYFAGTPRQRRGF